MTFETKGIASKNGKPPVAPPVLTLLASATFNFPLQRDASPASRLRAPELAR
jgi:hypothetical protein